MYYDPTGNLHLWNILPSRNFYLWMYCSYLPETCSSGYLAFRKLAYVYDTTYREDSFLCYDATGNWHLWKKLPTKNVTFVDDVTYWELALVDDLAYRDLDFAYQELALVVSFA